MDVLNLNNTTIKSKETYRRKCSRNAIIAYNIHILFINTLLPFRRRLTDFLRNIHNGTEMFTLKKKKCV